MVMSLLRSRYILFPIALSLAASLFLFFKLDPQSYKLPFAFTKSDDSTAPTPEPRKHPIYKDIPHKLPPLPLPEYFPLAATAKSSADLPPVPSWNRPPAEHVPEQTRLYIGFTRYWPLLQQVVVSYITAGWPPEDIYVVENTGKMNANKNGLLTDRNPFYLDYHRLTKIFGVNVIITPSYQSFAQLQNFYLSEAINNNFSYYFWGHMDVIAQSHEEKEPFKSLYMRAVDTIRETQAPGYATDDKGQEKRWGIRFFAYDWLTLVNVDAFVEVGGWDSMVSYYGTDCDMYARLAMAGLSTPIADAGQITDVGKSLDDLEVLYRRKPKNTPRGITERREVDIISNSTANSTTYSADDHPVSDSVSDSDEDIRGSKRWRKLQDQIQALKTEKVQDKYRNSWQLRQTGGQGEPYYYDPDGFEKALQWTIETGVKINEEKWGHKGCDIKDVGLSMGDQWRVEHDG